MNATRQRKPESDAEPPAPQVPPPMAAIGLHDQSFTLQAIMELQKIIHLPKKFPIGSIII